MKELIRHLLLKITPILLLILLLYSCSSQKQEMASADSALASSMLGGDADLESKSEEKATSDKKQVTTWKRSAIAPNTPKLFIGDREELPLKGTQMTVQVDGFRARVVLDCYYLNNRESQMEGTFKLQLPHDASPYYFAFGESVLMDREQEEKGWKFPFISYQEEINLSPEAIAKKRDESWTQVKEARIVPKEKAAFAYTQTARASVDPALMEWAGADIFNCRVFPLQSGKIHRIVIGYDVNLLETAQGRVLNVSIPNTGSDFKLEMDLFAASGMLPQIEPALKTERKGKRIRVQSENPYTDEIRIAYAGKTPVLLTDKDDNELSYFASSFTANLPEQLSSEITDNAILMVDISLSSNPDKFNVWLKLAEALLKNNTEVIRNFNVLFFNVEQFWWQPQPVPNTPENIRRFLSDAGELTLEGASDLGAALNEISLASGNQDSRPVFLLSDGAITWGEDDVHLLLDRIGKGSRIYAYKTGMEGTDSRVLAQLAGNTGGKLLSVMNENEVEKASKAFRNTSWKIESTEMEGASDLVLAGRPQYLYPGQQVIAAGRGRAGSRLLLHVSHGRMKKTITVDFKDQLRSSLAARVYGQIATAQLEDLGYYTEKYAKAFASYYRVPGQTCSFLMLDSEEDYQRFNIRKEEDLFVIRSVSVSKFLDETIHKIGNMLANPKAGFRNWLAALPAMSGVTFELPASLDILIDQTPEASFSIPFPKLSSKLRKKQDMRRSSLEALNAEELDYDIITAEAEQRRGQQGPGDGLKALSSLVEKNPGDGVLVRDVGFSAMEWGLNPHAYYLFKKIARSRPYEPQSYHALGQVLTRMKNADLAVLYYEVALAGKWDSRFGEFNRIVLMDYLTLLHDIENGKLHVSFPDYAKDRKKNLEKEFGKEKPELVIIMMWNTDNTDIDLHVVEPSGEECFYSQPRTSDGGMITRDVTQGYGPEMYQIRDMKTGTYKVRAHYYAKDRNRSSVRTKVYTSVYRNWGNRDQQEVKKVVTLDNAKEYEEIMTVKEGLF